MLELLTNLSPHHTRECTRNAQPLYKEQAVERYASLIGHLPPARTSWLDALRLNTGAESDFVLPARTHNADSHKYFFAINLYNSFDIIPDLFATLFRVASILGYPNVYVSIYENGSTDQTKALLRIFDALCRSVGLRVKISTSMRTRGAFNHRIEYLAEVRNAAFVPLHELRSAENEYFDTIIFMNDILPCVDDLLELIWQSRRNNAGITCAADYMYHEDLVSRKHPIRILISKHHKCRVRLFSMTIGLHEISTALRSKTLHSSLSSINQIHRNASSAIFLFKCNPAGTALPYWTPHLSTHHLTYDSVWLASQKESAQLVSVV